MKRSILLTISFVIIIIFPASGISGKIKMKYGFAPGQKWEQTTKSRTIMPGLGKEHQKQNKKTILYEITKGKKKGWVRLTAKYINPPDKTHLNDYTSVYNFTFTADVHFSGDTRNIQVSSALKAKSDPRLPPQQKAMMEQAQKMMMDAYKLAVFWFPELPEYALETGDEFEEKQAYRSKGSHMSMQTKGRTIFVLESVSEGLAYFSTKEKYVSKVKNIGGNIDSKMSGKGEYVFDLKSGMWIESKTKTKMGIAGGPMGVSGDGGGVSMIQQMKMRRR